MLLVPNNFSIAGVKIPDPIAVFGTIGILILWALLGYIGKHAIAFGEKDGRERYRKRQVFSTILAVVAIVIIVLLWARLLQHTGTFLGIVGAGLAVALREPLLSVAGRVAIMLGKMYKAGDRIEIDKLKGDVIDVGFFYTLMMEIGNWINGDQASGRIVQFANARVFGAPVFNYTRDLSYIWDEIKLPVTYDSNVQEATNILLSVGRDYTKEFLEGAQSELEQMRKYFLVPSLELKPNVYMKVTDNWVELHMRYVVDPKKRRAATTFIFSEVFRRVQGRKDISIASSTMDLTVHGEALSTTKPNDTDREKDAA